MPAEESPNTAFSSRSVRVYLSIKIGEHYRNMRGKYIEFVAVEGFKFLKPNLDSGTDRPVAKFRSRII